MPKFSWQRSRRAAAAAVVVILVVAFASAGYEVKPGDTLAEIAAEHGTTVSEIAEANGISNPNLIRVGQVLTIPGQGSGDSAGSYVVSRGDTLARIAQRHGTTVSELIRANSIPNPNLIWVGQELLIPGSGQPSEGGEEESSGDSSPQGGDGSPQGGSKPLIHVVGPGETLASIAARYGTTPEAVAAANGITEPSVIYEGTGLVVNGPPATVITSGTGRGSYTVQAGDTLAEIAIEYGATVSEIANANGISNPNHILPGQVLEVPGGGWVCPVPGARYFNDWGFPRSGGRFHQGNDLYAPMGTEVQAPVSGVVEQKTGTIGGLQAWLTGDDGHLYIGTHLQAFGAGGRVTAGQVIGYVGDSGNAVGSRPHLHFEIHVDGNPINPYPTLRANGC